MSSLWGVPVSQHWAPPSDPTTSPCSVALPGRVILVVAMGVSLLHVPRRTTKKKLKLTHHGYIRFPSPPRASYFMHLGFLALDVTKVRGAGSAGAPVLM